MSYHVEAPQFGFKELPDRILVREDGAYGDHKAHGTPIVDYWYVLEQRIPPTEREIISAHLEQLEVDNAKLRVLLLDCWDFSHLMHEAMAARFYELGLIDDDEARELGVEVDG